MAGIHPLSLKKVQKKFLGVVTDATYFTPFSINWPDVILVQFARGEK